MSKAQGMAVDAKYYSPVPTLYYADLTRTVHNAVLPLGIEQS